MAVYHMTYSPEMEEVCLYFDAPCPLRCWGCITDFRPLDCHLEEVGVPNPPLALDELLGILEGIKIRRVLFLGKEPSVDPHLLALLDFFKAKKTHTVLITNGWEVIGGVDEVCLSIKALTPHLFKAYTGGSDPSRILENFKIYAKSRVKLRAESVLIPGLIDPEEISRIAHFISGVNPGIPYRIDAYIPHPGDIYRAPTHGELRMAKRLAKRHLKKVSILHSSVKRLWNVERIY